MREIILVLLLLLLFPLEFTCSNTKARPQSILYISSIFHISPASIAFRTYPPIDFLKFARLPISVSLPISETH